MHGLLSTLEFILAVLGVGWLIVFAFTGAATIPMLFWDVVAIAYLVRGWQLMRRGLHSDNAWVGEDESDVVELSRSVGVEVDVDLGGQAVPGEDVGARAQDDGGGVGELVDEASDLGADTTGCACSSRC